MRVVTEKVHQFLTARKARSETMKALHKTALAAALATVTVTAAAAESPNKFTGNVAYTTDYVFRGISQTLEKPAIQGGMDYSHASGLYLGTWASSVDFGDTTQSEWDWYGGFANTIGSSKLGYDVGVLSYNYTGGSDDYDFVEVYGKLSYDFGKFAVKGGLNYSSDYFNSSGSATYFFADVDVPLPKDFGLSFHVGRQTIDDNSAFGTPNYTDYKIAANYSLGGFGLSLAYIDTDLDKKDCFGGTDYCDSRVVFTVSRSM